MEITISKSKKTKDKSESEDLKKEFFATYSKLAGSIKEISGPRGGKAKKEVLRKVIDGMKELEKLVK